MFEYGKNVPTETKHITGIIVSDDLAGEMLASAISQFVEYNAIFLVDTSHLGDWRDLKPYIDLKWSATKTYYFQKIKDQLVRCISGTYMYKATQFIYAHKDHADFHKIIATVNRFNGDQLVLFLEG